MDADAQVSPVASLIADRSRSSILWTLSDGRALPACELALIAGVKAPTISHHLTRLVDGGLVTSTRHGRQRCYRLANPDIVKLLETLATFAPPASARTFREGQSAKALRFGRTCYDHLAGRLGVAFTEALVRRRFLEPLDRDFALDRAGEAFLERLGVDVAAARGARRSFARRCLDWSERRYHLAGALGAAVLDRLVDLTWIRRASVGRAVFLSDEGRRSLRRSLELDL